MNLERLVCASCAHPVSEGRCASCRQLRAEHDRRGPLTPEMLVAILAMLLALTFFLAHATA